MLFFSQTKKRLVALDRAVANSFSNVKNDIYIIQQWVGYLNQNTQTNAQIMQSMEKRINHQNLQKPMQELAESLEEIKHRANQHESSIASLKAMVQEAKISAIPQKSIEKVFDTLISQGEQLASLKIGLKNYVKKDEFQHFIDEYIKSKSLLNRLSEIEKRLADLGQKKHILVADQLTDLKDKISKLETKKSSIKEKIMKKIARNSKEYLLAMISSYIRKYGEITGTQLREMIVEEQNLTSKSSFYRILDEVEESEEFTVVKKGKEKHFLSKNILNLSDTSRKK